jgi:hypothetical protein
MGKLRRKQDMRRRREKNKVDRTIKLILSHHVVTLTGGECPLTLAVQRPCSRGGRKVNAKLAYHKITKKQIHISCTTAFEWVTV